MDTLTRELLPRFADVRSLARELVRRDWVTPYQINQLFLGREQDLSLGPFLLLERLGEGGMGQVFKARHRKLNRVVALKVMRKDKLGNSEAVRRFYREVQAAAVLSHPNIVTAFDAGEIDGTHFLAMEYIDGSDLGKLVRKNGPQAVPVAIDYIRQAALGLQHAFEKGLVHRDIKPSNLIVQLSGTQSEAGPLVKILDMGLALVAIAEGAEASATLTQNPLGPGHSRLYRSGTGPQRSRCRHALGLVQPGLHVVLCPDRRGAVRRRHGDGETPQALPRRAAAVGIAPPRRAARRRGRGAQADVQVAEQRYQTPAELAAVLGSVLNVRAACPSPCRSPFLLGRTRRTRGKMRCRPSRRPRPKPCRKWVWSLRRPIRSFGASRRNERPDLDPNSIICGAM